MGVMIDEVVSEIRPEAPANEVETPANSNGPAKEDKEQYKLFRLLERSARRQRRLVAD